MRKPFFRSHQIGPPFPVPCHFNSRGSLPRHCRPIVVAAATLYRAVSVVVLAHYRAVVAFGRTAPPVSRFTSSAGMR